MSVRARRGATLFRAWLPVAIVGALLLVSGCTKSPTPATSAPFSVTAIAPADRKPAPALAAERLDSSGTFTLADHAGEVIVINFWASWCGPCVAEAADLEQAYQATSSRQVTFLGVNTRDDRDGAKQFVRNHELTYPIVFDPSGKIAMGFAVAPSSIPSTMVIDRHGRIAAVAFGAVVRSTLEPVVSQIAAEAG